MFAFDAKSSHRSFATPRSWEYVNKILKSTPEPELLMPLISGSIGEELAAEFLSWRTAAGDLPDLNNILEGKDEIVPDDPNALHVLASMIMQYVTPNTNRETLEHLLNYLMKVSGEFSVMIVKELQHKGVLLEKADNWKEWVKEFSFLLV